MALRLDANSLYGTVHLLFTQPFGEAYGIEPFLEGLRPKRGLEPLPGFNYLFARLCYNNTRGKHQRLGPPSSPNPADMDEDVLEVGAA